MVISDPRHTDSANLTEARLAYYICNHENNMHSRFSAQWFFGNSYTWADDVRLHIAFKNEPNNAQEAKQGA